MGKGVAEREINLWDMLWAVCLKWRSILACAIIFTILAGGFSYLKSLKAVHAAKESEVLTAAEMYEELTYEEQKTADMYMNYKQMYEELAYYNENAPLMKLNANDFFKGEVSFYVDNYYLVEYPIISKEDNAIAIVNAYKGVIGTQEFTQKLVGILGNVEKSSYALEMVDCRGVYSGTNVVDEAEDRGIFTVCFYAADEETCAQIEELVKESILGQKAQMTKQFGKHEITVIQEYISNTSSFELLEKQRIVVERTYACSNNMYNMSLKFSDALKTYIKQAMLEINLEESVEEDEEEVLLTPTVSKKLVVLGFLGGAFLMFVIWVASYILSGKIRLEDDFEQIFACKLLGNVSVNKKSKLKWFTFVDCIFEKLRHFNQRYFEEDDALDMIAANIRIIMQKAAVKRVMFTGAVCGDEEKKVVEALSNRLKDDGIEIFYESPILYNAESLEKLVEVGCVVLVEKAEKSLYQEVEKEIEICAQQEVTLIGCVVAY